MNYFNSINFPKSEQKTNKPYKPNTNPEKGGGGDTLFITMFYVQ